MVHPAKRFHWNPRAITEDCTIRRCSQIITLALLCAAAQLSAHRLPGSLTSITSNQSTGMIEIVHRLHYHDAESGLAQVLGQAGLSLDSVQGRAQLALYVEQRFGMAAQAGGREDEALQLDLVGAEADGEFILVYQEFSGRLPNRLAIRNDILRDAFPAQVNQVNLSIDRQVKSLTFSGEDRWLTVILPN
jgi:hypothetical protein